MEEDVLLLMFMFMLVLVSVSAFSSTSPKSLFVLVDDSIRLFFFLL